MGEEAAGLDEVDEAEELEVVGDEHVRGQDYEGEEEDVVDEAEEAVSESETVDNDNCGSKCMHRAGEETAQDTQDVQETEDVPADEDAEAVADENVDEEAQTDDADE